MTILAELIRLFVPAFVTVETIFYFVFCGFVRVVEQELRGTFGIPEDGRLLILPTQPGRISGVYKTGVRTQGLNILAPDTQSGLNPGI